MKVATLLDLWKSRYKIEGAVCITERYFVNTLVFESKQTCEAASELAMVKVGRQTGPQAEAESAAVAKDMRASNSDIATTVPLHRACSVAKRFTSPCKTCIFWLPSCLGVL